MVVDEEEEEEEEEEAGRIEGKERPEGHEHGEARSEGMLISAHRCLPPHPPHAAPQRPVPCPQRPVPTAPCLLTQPLAVGCRAPGRMRQEMFTTSTVPTVSVPVTTTIEHWYGPQEAAPLPAHPPLLSLKRATRAMCTHERTQAAARLDPVPDERDRGAVGGRADAEPHAAGHGADNAGHSRARLCADLLDRRVRACAEAVRIPLAYPPDSRAGPRRSAPRRAAGWLVHRHGYIALGAHRGQLVVKDALQEG